MAISKTMRSVLIAAMLGAASAPLLAPLVLPAWAQGQAKQGQAKTVAIENFTFSPPTLTVKAGTTVTWTNRDDIPHGIASSSSAFTRSQALDTDDSFSFTFTTPGIYEYFCYIHPHMVGKIVVEAATGSNTTQ